MFCYSCGSANVLSWNRPSLRNNQVSEKTSGPRATSFAGGAGKGDAAFKEPNARVSSEAIRENAGSWSA